LSVRSLAFDGVADPNAALVGLGDRAHDGQAESGAAARSGATGVGAVEALEHALAFVRGYSRPVIGHDEADPVRRQRPHVEVYEPLAFGGVLDRVAREVPKRLRQAVGVRVQRAVGEDTELEPAICGQAEAVPQIGDERAQIDGFDAQEIRPLRLGQDEQVVDQPADAGDLGPDEALDAGHLGRGRILLGGEHLELAADHGQRRAQLV